MIKTAGRCLYVDQKNAGRVAALAVLSALLEGSKPFLSVAKASDARGSGAFTSLSGSVAAMLAALHAGLGDVLRLERQPAAQMHALKVCLSVCFVFLCVFWIPLTFLGFWL
jgi:hypothetical protein